MIRPLPLGLVPKKYPVTLVPCTCIGGLVLWSLYSRCPQKAPFLTPPPTPKFALAPAGKEDAGEPEPTMNPPPVTKSQATLSPAGMPALTGWLATTRRPIDAV